MLSLDVLCWDYRYMLTCPTFYSYAWDQNLSSNAFSAIINLVVFSKPLNHILSVDKLSEEREILISIQLLQKRDSRSVSSVYFNIFFLWYFSHLLCHRCLGFVLRVKTVNEILFSNSTMGIRSHWGEMEGWPIVRSITPGHYYWGASPQSHILSSYVIIKIHERTAVCTSWGFREIGDAPWIKWLTYHYSSWILIILLLKLGLGFRTWERTMCMSQIPLTPASVKHLDVHQGLKRMCCFYVILGIIISHVFKQFFKFIFCLWVYTSM